MSLIIVIIKHVYTQHLPPPSYPASNRILISPLDSGECSVNGHSGIRCSVWTVVYWFWRCINWSGGSHNSLFILLLSLSLPPSFTYPASPALSHSRSMEWDRATISTVEIDKGHRHACSTRSCAVPLLHSSLLSTPPSPSSPRRWLYILARPGSPSRVPQWQGTAEQRARQGSKIQAPRKVVHGELNYKLVIYTSFYHIILSS